MNAKARDAIAALAPDVVAWRHHIHTHPELGFQEHETARFVAEKLRAFGLDEVHEGIGGTGVVGVLRGGSGPRTIGLRAELDALPVVERTGLPYASKKEGVMHACGHDGHTAKATRRSSTPNAPPPARSKPREPQSARSTLPPNSTRA